jgi:hypothetical protein
VRELVEVVGQGASVAFADEDAGRGAAWPVRVVAVMDRADGGVVGHVASTGADHDLVECPVVFVCFSAALSLPCPAPCSSQSRQSQP